jgi:hypothetical protein
VPQLRSSNNIRAFNTQLRSFDQDLEAWRAGPGRNMDFTQLDRANGARASRGVALQPAWRARPSGFRRDGCGASGACAPSVELTHLHAPRHPTPPHPTPPPPGAGWDLAKRLLAPRDSLNRGRLSVDQALGHRYFSPIFG